MKSMSMTNVVRFFKGGESKRAEEAAKPSLDLNKNIVTSDFDIAQRDGFDERGETRNSGTRQSTFNNARSECSNLAAVSDVDLVAKSKAAPRNSGAGSWLLREGQSALMSNKVSSALVARFDERKSSEKTLPKFLLMRGLCNYSLGDFVGSFLDFRRLLEMDPEHYLGRRYYSMCCQQDHNKPFLVKIFPDEPMGFFVDLAANATDRVLCEKDDVFGRTMKACMLNSVLYDEKIVKDLQEIVAEFPYNALPHSALSIHFFGLAFSRGDTRYFERAAKSATDALRLDWHEDTAFSILWWSIHGEGRDEFKGALTGSIDRSGNPRRVRGFAYLTTTHMFNTPFVIYDEYLKKEVFSSDFCVTSDD